jgi:class 3 adenylate cyclase
MRFSATLISFSGDGLLVLVNAPVALEERALTALDLAVEMQRSVQSLILIWRASGYRIGFGVGLASGSATVGRIGYQDRFDYTAIGSVVNLAARLCASAADREVLVDAEVARLVGSRRPLKGLGNRPIKGFEEAIPVFGLMIGDDRSPALSA